MLYKPDPSRTKVILARHAERFNIEDLETSHTVLLTEKGKQDAYAFGRSLSAGHKEVILFHSPVDRCRQTADQIGRGLRDNGATVASVSSLPWLGGEPLAVDTGFADTHIRDHGVDAFLRAWFDGGLPPERVAPLDVAARFQLRALTGQAVAQSGLVIDISHDWNIMILLEYYFHLRHEEIGIPGFLDFLSLSAGKESACVRYHDREITVPLELILETAGK